MSPDRRSPNWVWYGSLVIIGVCTIIVALWIFRGTGPITALGWILPVGLVLGVGGWWTVDRLVATETELHSISGVANWITIGRGICVAYLAGFLLVRPPTEAWLWAPVGLYTVVAVGDYLDGFVARKTDRVTDIGTRLDTEVDALGILVAAGVGILLGHVPVWYLVAGIARYFFVVDRYRRMRAGLPVHSLSYSRTRRSLAGLQMAYLVVALMPMTGPPLTTIVGAVVLVPFLVGFALDWLTMTGRR